MNNLQLIPDIHRPQNIFKAAFAYDWELIAFIMSNKGVSWSQILQSGYFSKKDKKSPNLISKNEITKRIGQLQALLGHGNSKTTNYKRILSQPSYIIRKWKRLEFVIKVLF